MPAASTVGVWFRKGLRLHDNWALLHAAEIANAEVLPFFVLDTNQFTTERFSVNRFRFLLDALRDLDNKLKEKFGAQTHGLVVFRGKVEEVIESLCEGTCSNAKGVKLTHLLYEFDSGPYGRERDERVEAFAKRHGVDVKSFGGHTIMDLRKCKEQKIKMPTTMKMIQNLVKEQLGCASADKLDKIPKPKPAPVKLGGLPAGTTVQSIAKSAQDVCPKQRLSIPELEELGYKESPHPLSAEQFPGGESAALKRLYDTVSAANQRSWVCEFQKPKTSSTNRKATGRNGGDDWTTPTTTGLSPYLAQGSLSVREVWHAIQKVFDQAPKGKHAQPPESLHGQLLFREMFYVLGYCVDNFHMPEKNAMCKDIKWGGGVAGSNGATLVAPEGQAALKAWQEGRTGFPLIDAYMRQLTTTGWLHHLGRHAVACFLTRGDLYLSWVHGRDFFDKHLLDGDWAVNNGNWLWLAGVAPFSSPWFRVYSPTPPTTGAQSALNAEQSGDFVRFWVPELKNFPTKFIYEPSKAPQLAQSTAKCQLGRDYPKPIVQHSVASKANMGEFKKSLDDLSGKRQASGDATPAPSAKKQRKI